VAENESDTEPLKTGIDSFAMADGEREGYRDRLVEDQIALSQRLRRADTRAEMASLAEDLAGTLRDVAENQRLWADVEAGAEVGLEEQQLFQLTLVDWEQVLRDRGVEAREAEALTDELIAAARRASEGQAHWGEVREGLVALASRLEEDAAEERRGRGGPLTSLRERVACGVAALGHIKKAVLLKGASEGLANVAVPAVAAAVIAGVAFPPGFLVAGIAAGVAGLGFAAGEALNRGLGEVADQEVADRFRRLEVEFSQIRREIPACQAELDELGRPDLETAEDAAERIARLLSSLRSWVAGVGAKLAAEWPFVVAHFGQAGALALENATSAIVEVRRLLRPLWEAIDSDLAEAVERAAGAAGAALRAVDGQLDELQRVLMVGAYRL